MELQANSPITNGYGEFVAYSPSSPQGDIDRKTFDKIYKIFCSYSPAALAEAYSGDQCVDRYKNRFTLIQKEVDDIAPGCKIAFIPKTLYELRYINKSIREDIKRGKQCSWLNRKEHHPNHYRNKIKLVLSEIKDINRRKKNAKNDYQHITDQKKRERFIREDLEKLDDELHQAEHQLERKKEKAKNHKPDPKCWHSAYFCGVGAIQENQDSNIKTLAYRMNQSFAKICFRNHGELSYSKITQLAQTEIAFLENYYQKCNPSSKQKEKKEFDYHAISNCDFAGPTNCFGAWQFKGSIAPMGIRDEKDKALIIKAINLECAELASRHVILWRGTDLAEDKPFLKSNDEEPYSLSAATGLFSGVMFDAGATAFQFIRNSLYGYGLFIPVDQYKSSCFYIPESNTLSQLCGDGEFFHARTKAWKGAPSQRKLNGVAVSLLNHGSQYLKSSMSKSELLLQFDCFKINAVYLKSPTLDKIPKKSDAPDTPVSAER